MTRETKQQAAARSVCSAPPLSGTEGFGFTYLPAGAEVAGLFAVLTGLTAFLFFFTCFLVVVVAVLVVVEFVAGAGACAASDSPAVARESPKSTAKIFFIFDLSFTFSAKQVRSASVDMDGLTINRR